ncbi:MAG: lysostaphin resistance A-like protein [Acidobacteriota bacterium]
MPDRGRLQDLLALIFAMAFPSAAAWLYFVLLARRDLLPAAYSACKIIQFAFPVAWTFLMRRPRARRAPVAGGGGARSVRAGHAPRRSPAAGPVSGLAMGALLWGAYLGWLRGGELAAAAAPRIISKLEAIGADTPARFLALTLFLSVLHALLEEYYWRWFVFGQIRERVGFLPSAAVSSLAFMAHHVILAGAMLGPARFWSAALPLSLAVALAGAVWAWLYERGGTLISPWLSHLIVDLAIMAIGYDIVWRLF